MSCCNQLTTMPLTERHRLRVRYLGGRPIAVTGPTTGTVYQFSGLKREQFVDPRDGVAIAKHSGFRIEGIVELDEPATH